MSPIHDSWMFHPIKNRINSLVRNFCSIFGKTRLNVLTYVKLCDKKIQNSFNSLIDLEKCFKHNKILIS
jgi:hypothetical protein